jgi:hypothetical protein
MVVDTSALVCILLAEPEAEDFARAIASAPDSGRSDSLRHGTAPSPMASQSLSRAPNRCAAARSGGHLDLGGVEPSVLFDQPVYPAAVPGPIEVETGRAAVVPRPLEDLGDHMGLQNGAGNCPGLQGLGGQRAS